MRQADPHGSFGRLNLFETLEAVYLQTHHVLTRTYLLYIPVQPPHVSAGHGCIPDTITFYFDRSVAAR